jgi:hypothetical protein
MMVLSLVAPTGAQAAAKYSVTGYKTVKAATTRTYTVKGVKKTQYIKVQRNVTGETVKYNNKALTYKTKVKGTGKNLALKVKFSEKKKNYTGKFTVRIYNAKTNKLVKKLVKSVKVKTQVKEEVAVTGVSLDNTTPKVGDTITAKVEPADAEIASYVWYADGVAIENATTATYTVTDAELNKKLSVAATDVLGNTVTSEQTAAVVEADKKELELTAKQTGAATIEVVSNIALTNEDAITVTRGTTEQTVTKAFSEDGKTVTLTLATAITASEYVIKVVPKDTAIKEATVTVKGEKAVLSKIKFESDRLVLLSNAGREGSVVVTGSDQFGAKVAISKSNTTFYATGATMKDYTSDTGVLVLEQSGVYPFTVGQTIQVTVVYNNGTLVLQESATLTISGAAYVKTLEFGELATTNADLKGKRVTIDNFSDNSYYYPVKATNQYDQVLTATDLKNMKEAGTLITSPDGTGYAYVETFDTLKDGTIIAKVKKGTANLIPTTVPITFVSVGGGSFTQNLVIEDNPYIATLDVSIPEAYSNVKVEASISAKDQNGEAYDIYTNGAVIDSDSRRIKFNDMNHLTTKNSEIKATYGTFSMVKDSKRKTVKFYYVCENNGATTKSDTITVTTAVPTITPLVVTVNPAGTVAKVQGLASGVKTELKGTDDPIQLGKGYEKNIVFLDSYGAVMTNGLPTFENDTEKMNKENTYYYSVTCGTNEVTDGKINWADYSEKNKDVSKTFTITLYKGAGAKANVEKINSVEFSVKFVKSSITYECELATGGSLLYVADDSTDYDAVTVYKYVDGVYVGTLGEKEYSLSDDLGLVDGVYIRGNQAGNLPANTTGKDVINVTVGDKVVDSVVVEYSNVKPVATAASFIKTVSGKATAAPAKITVAAKAYKFTGGIFTINDGKAIYNLCIVNQYGQIVTDEKEVGVKLNGHWLNAEKEESSLYWVGNNNENTVMITAGEVAATVTVVCTSDSVEADPLTLDELKSAANEKINAAIVAYNTLASTKNATNWDAWANSSTGKKAAADAAIGAFVAKGGDVTTLTNYDDAEHTAAAYVGACKKAAEIGSKTIATVTKSNVADFATDKTEAEAKAALIATITGATALDGTSINASVFADSTITFNVAYDNTNDAVNTVTALSVPSGYVYATDFVLGTWTLTIVGA